MHYVHTHHLGSLNVLTDENGAIEQELSFDAWGNRRNPYTGSKLTATELAQATTLTSRGFTGHEHIDGMELRYPHVIVETLISEGIWGIDGSFHKGWDIPKVQYRKYRLITYINGRAAGGGGLDPSITAGLAVGGGMIGGLEQSYKYGNNNVKYAQRVNGKVRTPSVLTRANQMNATKMDSGLKVVGRGVAGLSVAASGYQFFNSDMSGNDYARLSGSFIITGTAFIPIVGPVISIGLGVADSYGAFDGIYNYFD